MKNNSFFLIQFILLFIFSIPVFSQAILTGNVTDLYNSPIKGANVSLQPINKHRLTNVEGTFKFEGIPAGEYTITISHLGLATYTNSILITEKNQVISVTLEDDLLNLQAVVVTGTFDPRSQIETSTAVTSLNEKALKSIIPRGTADLLQAIPGTYVDAAAGEVFTRVYSRGIAASAEDDLGWYYVSLQEDGLPVSLVQHSYYSPDLFHRYDLTTKKVEAVRGGSASIMALNAPGGIYNFISHGRKEQLNGEIELQTGVQGDWNPYNRIDGIIGVPINDKWYFNIGGHYRIDEGARNVDFRFSEGGQVKFNLIREDQQGSIKFYGKVLDDFTNRWTGVAAVDWKNPRAAFGQDFNTSALLIPASKTSIPDGRDIANGSTNSFDPSQGVHAQDFSFGVDIFQELGNDWTLKNNIKLSHKNADWQTSISNAFVSLNNPFLAYFISGANFPIGQVVFNEVQTGNEIARLDNSETLNGGTINYLSDGRLPNDAILGTSTWFKQNTADEVINQLSFHKKWDTNQLSLGATTAYSNTSAYTQASFAYVTYEPNPRALQVTLQNPDQPVIALSDANGISNYGGLFYGNSKATVNQWAAFANDRWELTKKVHLDAGARFEAIKHQGSNDRFAPFRQEGGFDGNPITAFDNGILASTGEQDNFNYTYSYLSYSLGLNYKFKDNAALFTRFSRGNKAPELNYYFNNFSNVPINQKGEIQKIIQSEIGLKWSLSKFSFTTTAFWSELKNIGISSFEFDAEDSSTFYTPIQFNSSRTIGLEWESSFAPIKNLSFNFNGVLQNPKTVTWTIYDAAGTVDIADDSTQDFSGNNLPFNPKVLFNLGTAYSNNKINAFFKWQFMGEREGNVANAFQLPAYSIFNAGAGISLNSHWSINVLITNLFNSEGLTNFFGANSFGANANGVTTEFVNANPDASFIVVPVLPRAATLKLNYKF